MTVCSTTSSYVFSTRMNLAKSSKINSWNRGSSCRGRGGGGSGWGEGLPQWVRGGEGHTHRLARGRQLLEQERDGDLQQRLPEEPLPHRAAVVVVFLPGETGQGAGSPQVWPEPWDPCPCKGVRGASRRGSKFGTSPGMGLGPGHSPSAPAPGSAGWTCTAPPWWAPSPAPGAGGSQRCTRHCPFAAGHSAGT